MNREQYISKLLAIFKLKYKPSEVELEEFKLLLEMMLDHPILNIPPGIKDVPKEIPYPYPPTPVMYGVQFPGYTITINTSETTDDNRESQ